MKHFKLKIQIVGGSGSWPRAASFSMMYRTMYFIVLSILSSVLCIRSYVTSVLGYYHVVLIIIIFILFWKKIEIDRRSLTRF